MPSIPFSSTCSFYFFYNSLLLLYIFLVLLIGKIAMQRVRWLFFSFILSWVGGLDSAYWDEWERRHGSGGKGILSL